VDGNSCRGYTFVVTLSGVETSLQIRVRSFDFAALPSG
jgi:hypothetical protein